ncbi:hypothetical protein L9F63_007328, partial [Diploptera punctata]
VQISSLRAFSKQTINRNYVLRAPGTNFLNIWFLNIITYMKIMSLTKQVFLNIMTL